MEFFNLCKRGLLILCCCLLAFSINLSSANAEDIGVILVVHGGMIENKTQSLWDAVVHQFSYDQNHSVYKLVIWDSAYWPLVLDPSFTEWALRFLRMYAFEYEIIGGTDPFHAITDQQLADMEAELDANPYGINFEVDWAGYMAAASVDHYAYPRFIYYGPDGPGVGDNCTYCGDGEPGGAWPGCDPERYNVDGPVERLLNKGVSRIIVVDWTMGGPRFSKTFDVVEKTTLALDDWNTAHGTSIPLLWVNDYSKLMERSYPIEPEGWTRILKVPILDSHVLLNGSPNPIVPDPIVTTLQVEAVETAFSSTVPDADTGVILYNHALHDYNEPFDPKINDTLIMGKNVKDMLLDRHPTMDPDNIVGAFGGIQEINPQNELEERNREMRGESYGHAWLYETEKELPGEEWGYRYWDALEYLKNRGVQHIAISFPQVVTDNALNMVEIYNQIAGREIGYKNWAKWGTWDFTNYPVVGHPFADYWGIWVDTDCGEWELNYDNGMSEFSEGATLTGQTSGATAVIKWFSGNLTAGILTLKGLSGTFLNDETITDDDGGAASANGTEIMTSKPECCFEMGGCGDTLRPYPPLRQTSLNQKMTDLDPSLCFDMSEYGHLGYDPASGPPNPNAPVQDQYTGTWEMYTPPNDDPRVGQMLAQHVLNASVNPMVYITNGELEGIAAGESVTFEAHVTGGGVPAYTYEWSIKKEGDASWSTVGGNSSTWSWTPGEGDIGTYALHCKVTDSQGHTGEVTWEDFMVTEVIGAVINIGSQWANCGDVGVKIPICLVNLEAEVGAVQVDLCEDINDCLICVGCEMTERTVIFDCMVNELENGCCAVVVFSKNPGGVINPGECNIVIIDYTLKDEEECCNNCINIVPENIEVVDQYGYLIGTAVGDIGMVCPFECGDVEPASTTAANWDCGDGDVDIFDILEEVDFIIHVKDPDECQAVRADVPTGTPPDCDPPDDVIDVGDLMVIIDMALNRQDCCSYYYGGVIY